MKVLLTVLVLLLASPVLAPELGSDVKMVVNRVRFTAASAKQRGESNKNAWGQSIKNERYVAVRPGFLPRYTIVRLPNGEIRDVNDHIPKRAERIIGTKKIIDVYYYESVKSKSKTKAVSKELRCKFDQGWDSLEIIWMPR